MTALPSTVHNGTEEEEDRRREKRRGGDRRKETKEVAFERQQSDRRDTERRKEGTAAAAGLPHAEQFARERTEQACAAQRALARCSTEQKNAALASIAASLRASAEGILAANARDLEAGRQAGLGTKLDRLRLDGPRLEAIADGLAQVAALGDPVGQSLERRVQPGGLLVERVRVPLGVVGMIYESRPNVTVDAAALCLKAGNAVVLKGGADALHSNRALVEAIREGLRNSALPPQAVQLLDSADRAVTLAFLGLRGLLDVIIPRGGLNLIRFVRENACVPVIETGASVVHAYVDARTDVAQAVRLIMNAKTRRPAICGALDVLLVHQETLAALAPPLAEALQACPHRVQLRADARAQAALAGLLPETQLRPLGPQDYDTEFLDYVLAIGVVASLDEALAHIRRHSLRHTEAIYTTDPQAAARFMDEVDAACVMHNASTQFTDGAQFGLGAEIGISTQKLHVRGPFALDGLTSTKWRIRGDWLTRP